ncbi:MAG: hypothetical protein BJ554DRAFT_5337 [Olpidium bornovanus]|uniref:Uncharacterized protein n=1 Tax=Olpidium bornovanus TaxID=278681 RepID=A0A8H8DME8_9FUNG|nr:MAG: hypothetical protein BJ554DRAFT_5337 [Olpidium bornovanus]
MKTSCRVLEMGGGGGGGCEDDDIDQLLDNVLESLEDTGRKAKSQRQQQPRGPRTAEQPGERLREQVPPRWSPPPAPPGGAPRRGREERRTGPDPAVPRDEVVDRLLRDLGDVEDHSREERAEGPSEAPSPVAAAK